MPKSLLFPLILIIAGLIIYSFNLKNPLFWDDTVFITTNRYIQKINKVNIVNMFTKSSREGSVGIPNNYYRPLWLLSFAFNYSLHGTSPAGYHLVNNFLHIINSILVFFLIGRLFHKRTLAFLTALIFLIHPVQVESVAYISVRGELMNGFFILSGLLLLLAKIRYNLLFIPLLFIASLLSKEAAIVFPLLCILVFMCSRGGFNHQFLKKVFPVIFICIMVATAYIYLRLTVLNFANTLNLQISSSSPYTQNLFVRFFTFTHVVWEYIRILLVPYDLRFRFSGPIHTSFWQFPVWFISLTWVVILFFLVWLYRKNKKNNTSSDFHILLFGIGWFFINLAPVSGVIPINAIMQEHWLYLPMIGIFTICFFYLQKVLDALTRLKQNKFKYVLYVLLVPYFLMLSYVNIIRNITWGYPETIYTELLTHELRPSVLNNLAAVYVRQGKIDQAESLLKKALMYKDSIMRPGTIPQLYSNLGEIAKKRGNNTEAISYFEKALEDNEKYFPSLINLAILYGDIKDRKKSAFYFEKVIELYPEDPNNYYNAAYMYLLAGETDKAYTLVLNGLKTPNLQSEMKSKFESLKDKITSNKD